MSRICLDAECDDLLPFVTEIYVVVTMDLDTGEVKHYTNKAEFTRDSAEWDTILTHGGLSYDMLVFWRIWGLRFSVGPDTFNDRPVKHIDSLVVSRYTNPDRIWGHGLDGWGKHLGFGKTEWTDFSEYSEEQAAYCENDVRLTVKVWKYLEQEMTQ